MNIFRRLLSLAIGFIAMAIGFCPMTIAAALHWSSGRALEHMETVQHYVVCLMEWVSGDLAKQRAEEVARKTRLTQERREIRFHTFGDIARDFSEAQVDGYLHMADAVSLPDCRDAPRYAGLSDDEAVDHLYWDIHDWCLK